MCQLAFFQNPLTGHVDQFLLSPIFWDTHGGSGCRTRTNAEQIYRMPPLQQPTPLRLTCEENSPPWQIASVSRAEQREAHCKYMCQLAFFQNPLTGHVDQFLLSPIFWDTHGGSGCRTRTNTEQIYRMPIRRAFQLGPSLGYLYLIHLV
jgi:hypothetical protein